MVLVALGLLMFRGSASTPRTCTSSSAIVPLVTGIALDDVADDGGDHVGGAGASGRRGLGDERRDP